MKAESIVFYKTFYEALKADVSDEDFMPPGAATEAQRLEAQQAADAARWRALEAIFEYSFNDADPAALLKSLDGVSRAVFRIARPLIDANYARREGGKKGGRPRKNRGEDIPGAIGTDGKFHPFSSVK